MQSKGWVKLWREQFSHEVSERKPWCDGYAWSYLYSQANYKPGVVNFRNQYIPVERGQFITSVLKLSKIFGWSRKTNELVPNFPPKSGYDDWKSGTNWDQKGTRKGYNRRDNRFTMITICNYEKFQSTENENETTDVTTDVTTEAQQKHTIKEVKEVKNIGRSKKQTDPRVKEFFNYWGEIFLKETGQPYVFSLWEGGRLIKDLLKVHPLEVLKDNARISSGMNNVSGGAHHRDLLSGDKQAYRFEGNEPFGASKKRYKPDKSGNTRQLRVSR